jgi:hypothetical protein
MADGGFRDAPSRAPSTEFYSITAGETDEIVCATGWGCGSGLFDPAPNVREQVVVDVGHFGARSQTAELQVRMLQTR